MPSSTKPTSYDLHLLRSLLPLSLSLTNTHILHLNRLLSSTTHIDALLSTFHYTLALLSTFPHYSSAAAALAALLARVRTTLRLTGLIGIWARASRLLGAPPRDAIMLGIAWAQTGAGAAYQALENVALLGETGALTSRVGAERRKWLWRWSSRAWMMWVGLEAGRLGREWALEEERRKKGEEVMVEGGDEMGEKAAREVRRVKWWRQAVVTGVSLPLTLHWSVDEGVLGERLVNTLGLVVGGMALEQAWRESA